MAFRDRVSSGRNFPQICLPAVLAASKPAVEKTIALLAGNSEVDECETQSRDYGLLTLAAPDDCPDFHSSPPHVAGRGLVRQRTRSSRFAART
jgi:hypothetical protein